jgi:hypothetical protein
LRLERRAWLASALLVLAGRARAFDLPALAAVLAQRRDGQARFTEERFVAGFDAPLRASGTLAYAAPDRFSRHTVEPREETMAVVGNRLTLSRGGRTRQLALDTMPELAALIEALRATLTGDAAALERHFHVRVEGDAARWTLTLVPRDARLAAQVREVQIAGLAGEPRSVALWLADGDRSVLTIVPATIEPAPK